MIAPAFDLLRSLPGFRSTGKNQYEAKCPAHEDHTASLSIGLGDDGKILLHCFAGCDLARILEGARIDPKDLFSGNGNGQHPTGEVPYWRRIWDETIPLDAKAAEPGRLYLRNRGLNLPHFPTDIRFHSSLAYFTDKQTILGKYAALVCIVRDARLQAIGAHRIYLSIDGRKADVPEPKKAIGPVSGGAVFLGEHTDSLNVAEGPETALAVWQATGLPTCAAISAGGMSKLEIPEGVKTLDIWADLDRSGTGERAAGELAARVNQTGKTVFLRLPAGPILDGSKSRDWLDVLNSEGSEAFQYAMERGEPWQAPEVAQPTEIGFLPPAHWQLLDGSTAATWACEALVWIIEKIFARGNLLIMAAQTQTGKTLLGIFIALKMLRGGLLFGKFPVTRVGKILYLVLEDPPRRIKSRILDDLREGDAPIEPGRFTLYFAPGFKLNDDLCFQHLEQMIEREKYDVVFIDTYQRATPGISSFDAEKQSIILHRLADLTRKFSVALWVNDHFRKSPNAKKRTELDPNDVKGDGGKLQNADAFLLMDRDGGRLRVKGSSKDADQPIGFLLDVAPEGCRDREKFTYAGDLEDFATQSRVRGNATREGILGAMEGVSWISSGEIGKKIEMTASTVRRQLEKLIAAGKVEEQGDGKWKRYRLINRACDSNELRDMEN